VCRRGRGDCLHYSSTIGANLLALHRQLADCPAEVDVGDLQTADIYWAIP
jgi:hypothetical protein